MVEAHSVTVLESSVNVILVNFLQALLRLSVFTSAAMLSLTEVILLLKSNAGGSQFNE